MRTAQQQLLPLIDRIVPIACEQGLAELTEPERTVYLAWCYSAEVCNGGHAQFFYNSTGAFAFETVEALLQIGAPDFAKLLDRMIDIFPNRVVPKDLEERNHFLVSLVDQVHSWDNHPGRILEESDAEFFRLTNESLMDRLLAYWKAQNAL